LNSINAELTGHPDHLIHAPPHQGHGQAQLRLRQGLDLLRCSVKRKQLGFHQGGDRETTATIDDIHPATTAQTQHPSEVVLLFWVEQNQSTLHEAIRRQE
jgi:hypothetical protein